MSGRDLNKGVKQENIYEIVLKFFIMQLQSKVRVDLRLTSVGKPSAFNQKKGEGFKTP
jgi:hypothetical protein